MTELNLAEARAHRSQKIDKRWRDGYTELAALKESNFHQLKSSEKVSKFQKKECR